VQRRAWVRASVLVGLAAFAPAMVPSPLASGDGTGRERKVEIAVDLQDGFIDDTLSISAGGRELFREEGLNTRFQIGLAKSIRLEVPAGRATLTVDVPTKGASTTVPIDTSEPVFVGISVTKDGKVDVKVQTRPFGYL
jgi:hypothetical protein